MLSTLLLKQKSKGRTILLTTHDLHLAVELSDRYIILDRHAIVEDGNISETSPEDLRTRFFQPLEKAGETV